MMSPNQRHDCPEANQASDVVEIKSGTSRLQEGLDT